MAALLVTAVGFETAQAHFYRAPSRVSIHFFKNRFFGRVRSPRLRCQQDRVVTLIKARPFISDQIVGRTRSGRHGKWRIFRHRRPHGHFYAIVHKRTRIFYRHVHRCRHDRSRIIHLRS